MAYLGKEDALVEIDRDIAKARGLPERTTQELTDERAAIESLDPKKIRFIKESEKGNSYTVSLDVEPDELLDWFKPLSEQSEKVQSAAINFPRPQAIVVSHELSFGTEYRVETRFPNGRIREMGEVRYFDREEAEKEAAKQQGIYDRPFGLRNNSGANFYAEIGGDQYASEFLLKNGIPGIRYLDQRSLGNQWTVEEGDGKFYAENYNQGKSRDFSSRAAAEAFAAKKNGESTYNYVIFDESKIRITHRNGEALPATEEGAVVRHSLGARDTQRTFDDSTDQLLARADSPSNDSADLLRKNDNWTQAAWLKMQFSGQKLEDIPHTKLVEKMAEWRQNHPDAKAAAKTFPLPRKFLQGIGFLGAGTHSEDSRRSHEASLKQTGESASAASLAQFRAAAAPLVEASKVQGREFSPKILELVGARGGEHAVVLMPGRVLKFTEPDTAGGVVSFKENGEPQVFQGTLPDYLRQIETNQELVNDDTRPEGVMTDGEGRTRIVTSQKARRKADLRRSCLRLYGRRIYASGSRVEPWPGRHRTLVEPGEKHRYRRREARQSCRRKSTFLAARDSLTLGFTRIRENLTLPIGARPPAIW